MLAIFDADGTLFDSGGDLADAINATRRSLGLTPKPEDESAIGAGNVPPALRYQNEPSNVHLNEYGYDFLAHLIYERGKELGFWK